ncbi:DNA polymerase IV [Corynebacterium aurimucosum]|uniref:DNA polymerase IV n=1 Tax=Corynebacterium aurimucosum TaxID=169292 RepID=UPI00191CD983|nr:DNA polymerase IV [Corynebacterium aurimucosum]QQU94576.1 DNA polymerase IV [Corynebacterium aurimucosum]UTA72515.1 DNA polymerase IV [Corynebacterium aurimucosum]WJY70853.1 DNA polymerase IV [Corynebacterium aurimucosum]
MQRWVLHIDMDAFYASVEQLTRPTLRGRPVLVGGTSGRGVVAGASYEARAYGAHSAMPMFRAQQLVGFRAVVVQPRRAVYSVASRRVFEIIAEHAGVIEQLSIDEAFMEPEALVGASADEVREWAENLRRVIRAETGLPSSIGAGAGKQSAKIASGEAKPDGTFVVPRERFEELIHPLPVGKLWGAGPVTQQKLAAIGVETIGQLAAMSRKEVEISLGGVVGVQLWELAQGIDERPVAPRAIAKQISTEFTYPTDLRTAAEVDAALIRAAHGAHSRLLKDGRGARTVTVKLRMADFHIESRSATLPYATDDLKVLEAKALSLARYPEELGPIRLVGVSYSGLEEARQDVLFPELDHEIVRQDPDTDYETGVSDYLPGSTSTPVDVSPTADSEESPSCKWRATQDIYHPDFGHGWIQGAGHGVVSVRFETRATGPGFVRSFAAEDEELRPADPLDSLAWEDVLPDNDAELDGDVAPEGTVEAPPREDN